MGKCLGWGWESGNQYREQSGLSHLGHEEEHIHIQSDAQSKGQQGWWFCSVQRRNRKGL